MVISRSELPSAASRIDYLTVLSQGLRSIALEFLDNLIFIGKNFKIPREIEFQVDLKIS